MNKEKQREFIKKIGIRIQILRKSKGFSQKDVAFACDIEISQISRIERGIINTSIRQLKEIADSINVDIKDFFDFED